MQEEKKQNQEVPEVKMIESEDKLVTSTELAEIWGITRPSAIKRIAKFGVEADKEEHKPTGQTVKWYSLNKVRQAEALFLEEEEERNRAIKNEKFVEKHLVPKPDLYNDAVAMKIDELSKDTSVEGMQRFSEMAFAMLAGYTQMGMRAARENESLDRKNSELEEKNQKLLSDYNDAIEENDRLIKITLEQDEDLNLDEDDHAEFHSVHKWNRSNGFGLSAQQRNVVNLKCRKQRAKYRETCQQIGRNKMSLFVRNGWRPIYMSYIAALEGFITEEQFDIKEYMLDFVERCSKK